MGSAYNEAGDFLGSLQADSMREVFEKLERKFPEAARIEVHRAEAEEATKTPAPVPSEPPDPMEQFFRFEHLPPALAEVSRPFGQLASMLIRALPRNPERTVALRKLLEAKDCAVRALIYEPRRGR